LFSTNTSASITDVNSSFEIAPNQSGLVLSDSQTAGSFTASFASPAALSSNVYKITVESSGNGSSSSVATVYITGSVTFSSISAHENNTCGLSDGLIYCWGLNQSGQLGNGNFTNSNYPVGVSSITNAIQISVGRNAACAVLSNGTVKCWGENGNGGLGNGSQTNSNIPTSVLNVSSAIQVSAGDGSACALLSAGTIKCWGYNYWGNAGDGTSGSGGTDVVNSSKTTPVTVSGVADATQISVGNSRTCALLTDQTISCWGYGGAGQLGNGSYSYPTSSKFVVGGIANAISISGIEDHTCALLSTGAVKCWGLGNQGQLGGAVLWDAAKGAYLSSTPVTVAGISSATSISTGFNHSCATITGNTIYCWGSNSNGQLGDGTLNGTGITSQIAGEWTLTSTPIQVQGINDAGVIKNGGAHSCALSTSDTLKCWGSNSYGQLGISSNTDKKLPFLV